MSEPTGTDWSIPAIIGAGTTTITAVGAYLLGRRKQQQAECKEDDDRADKAYDAVIRLHRAEIEMLKIEQREIRKQADECHEHRTECEKRQARAETRIEWLERQISKGTT